MKSKLDLAHDYAMAFIREALKDDIESDFNHNLIALNSWSYADAMYEQLEKRESRGVPEGILNRCNSTKLEWQPDWSQAPSSMITHWSKERNGTCTWWIGEPCIDEETHFENPENPHSCCHSDAPSFGYKGNWQDSLRKRPEDK